MLNGSEIPISTILPIVAEIILGPIPSVPTTTAPAPVTVH